MREKKIPPSFFVPGVLEKFAYMSRGRRKEWTPGWASRKERRRGRGKVARRKGIRLLAQHMGDHMRERLNEESFARRVLLPRPVEATT